MKKNQIIILAIIIVLIFGGIIAWTLVQQSKIPGEEIIPSEETLKETFSFTATILSVDVGNNFLMVKPVEEEKEIKVVLSDTTKLVKIELPFDPKDPPKEATFTPKQTEIEISDFQEGDNVFIKAKENIAGKSEFNNIDFVHILP
jgi:hypothetical protein